MNAGEVIAIATCFALVIIIAAWWFKQIELRYPEPTEPPPTPAPISVATPASIAPPSERWCLLELMGHRVRVGRLTTESIAGSEFLKMEIPYASPEDPRGQWLRTEYYQAHSVYSIRPSTEADIRTIVPRYHPEAGTVEPPKPRQIDYWRPTDEEGQEEDEDDDQEEDEDDEDSAYDPDRDDGRHY